MRMLVTKPQKETMGLLRLTTRERTRDSISLSAYLLCLN